MWVLAKLLLGNVWGFLKSLPWQVWAVLGAIVLVWLGTTYHQRAVDNALAEAYAQGGDDSDKAWAKAYEEVLAKALEKQIEHNAKVRELNNKLGERHAQELRSNSALADDLRVRGPGAASARCRPGDSAGLPGAPVTHGSGAGGPAAPVGEVSDGDGGLALVPWADLVAHAERADANRSEVILWRAWYVAQRDALAAYKASFPPVTR